MKNQLKANGITFYALVKTALCSCTSYYCTVKDQRRFLRVDKNVYYCYHLAANCCVSSSNWNLLSFALLWTFLLLCTVGRCCQLLCTLRLFIKITACPNLSVHERRLLSNLYLLSLVTHKFGSCLIQP